MYLIAWLEFEFAYFKATVQHFSHKATWTPLLYLLSPNQEEFFHSYQMIALFLSYPSAEMRLMYSTAPADSANTLGKGMDPTILLPAMSK